MATVEDSSSCVSSDSEVHAFNHDDDDHDVRDVIDLNSDPNSEPDDDDREINLSLSVTVPDYVEETDTLKQVKLACRKEGVSEHLLEHLFDELVLDDEQTYGEAKALMCRRLFIKVPSDIPHLIQTTLISKVTNTIGSIIEIAREKTGTDTPADLDMMYKGKYLESHDTLESLEIPNDATLYLIPRPHEIISIIVIIPERKAVKFEVKKALTIWDGKTIAGCMVNTDVDKAAMMLNGFPTDDLRTFDSYGVPNRCIFELLFPFKVFVKVFGGTQVTIDVFPFDRLEDLNIKTANLLTWKLSDHPLYYMGVRVRNCYTMAHYGITQGSTLLLIPIVYC